MTYQYFSKWRKEWITFSQNPNEDELKKYKNYHYKIRIS
jgi:hypothetical protein